MSANHSRRGSSRVLPRRSTKGPLDVDDPLSVSGSLTASPARASSLSPAASTDLDSSATAHLWASHTANEDDASSSSPNSSKDLSFLLDASIYHPVSNIDTPAPYRQQLPVAPASNTSLELIFSELQELLQQCHFLAVAHLSAIALTSGFVKPTDNDAIFRLLSIRYSALELSGNVLLAAQESKALEDLSSSFYYHDRTSTAEDDKLTEGQQPFSSHIIPFDLRLQALRLQGIGFGDFRRTVGTLFDIGMECREKLVGANATETQLWQSRLEEVGVRVVNSLIEMGDLDCAKRTLQAMCVEQKHLNPTWIGRLILLLIKMGEIAKARKLLKESEIDSATQSILRSFVEIAEGDFVSAVKGLSHASSTAANPTLVAMAKQNLAVAYLYVGEIGKSRQILGELIDDGHSFQALTVNLATLYELTSDRSKDQKIDLAAKIARKEVNEPHRGFVNADFKL